MVFKCDFEVSLTSDKRLKSQRGIPYQNGGLQSSRRVSCRGLKSTRKDPPIEEAKERLEKVSEELEMECFH